MGTVDLRLVGTVRRYDLLQGSHRYGRVAQRCGMEFVCRTCFRDCVLLLRNRIHANNDSSLYPD